MIVAKASEKVGVSQAYAHDQNGRALNVVSPHTQRHAHAGRGATADALHALRVGEPVAGLHHMVVGKYRKFVTLIECFDNSFIASSSVFVQFLPA